MEIFGKTDTGKLREMNQDNFSYELLNEEVCFAFVCDGMGGPNGGKIASEIATNVLCENFSSKLKVDLNSHQIQKVVQDAFLKANFEILNCAKNDKNLAGMGTTVVGAVISKNNLHIFNIGDSRAYVFTGCGLKQLSVDHSYVQTLINCGKLTAEEARFHPRKNEITKAMGISEKIDYDFNSFVVNRDEIVLFCSDGLTNICSEDEIFKILKSRVSLKQKVFNLIDCANSYGGYDNVTVILIKI